MDLIEQSRHKQIKRLLHSYSADALSNDPMIRARIMSRFKVNSNFYFRLVSEVLEEKQTDGFTLDAPMTPDQAIISHLHSFSVSQLQHNPHIRMLILDRYKITPPYYSSLVTRVLAEKDKEHRKHYPRTLLITNRCHDLDFGAYRKQGIDITIWCSSVPFTWESDRYDRVINLWEHNMTDKELDIAIRDDNTEQKTETND